MVPLLKRGYADLERIVRRIRFPEWQTEIDDPADLSDTKQTS
jgi:hypothetical protein